MTKKSAMRKTRGKASGSNSTRNTASEVENASDVVLREIKDSFDFIGEKVNETAKSASSKSKAVSRKVIRKETTKRIQALLKDIEQAGESLLGVIGGHLDSLKKTALSASGSTPAKAAPKRKRGAVRKTAARRKSTGKRKTASKKAPIRKKIGRKKTATRKKAVVKKAATRKKTVTRKAAARKKTTSRMKAR